MNLEITQSPDHGLFFSLQPILNRSLRAWGHDLSFRDPAPELALAQISEKDEARATARVATLRSRVGEKKILVRFPSGRIPDKAPKGLSPEATVVVLDESSSTAPERLAALDRLKADKFSLALYNYRALDGAEALLERADFVKINLHGKRPEQLLDLMTKASRSKARLIAGGLDGPELFALAKSLGFNLFEGPFFKTPTIIPGRKPSSSEAARLELFKIIAGKPDFPRLSQAISMDPSISYRLLLFLNSAYFSFPMEITSIPHGVALLGWDRIKNWLWLAVLTDLAPAEKTRELITLSAQRAKFFEALAQRHGFEPESRDRYFLLGLFSLLDAILDTPMTELLENLPLDQEIKTALCRKKNIHAVWVEMVRRIEAADWKAVDRIIAFLRLDPEVVGDCYFKAHVAANSFFEMSA